MPNNERSEKIQQAKNTIERMLRYAASNPTIVLPNETLNNGIFSIRKETENYTNTDEVLLWKVYSELSIIISPASDISIQIADGLKDFIAASDTDSKNAPAVLEKPKRWHFSWSGSKSSGNKLNEIYNINIKGITTGLIVSVFLYVFIQCYIALLSDTLTNSTDLLSKHESLMVSRRLIIDGATPKVQSEQIYDEIEMLNNQLLASNQALIDLTTMLSNVRLSTSTLAALNACSSIRSINVVADNSSPLMSCIVLEREYASSIYTVLSRYILPLLLGFIGATAYITRNTLFHLYTNSYVPPHTGMLTMRLCLGGLLGAISGIFISAGAKEAEGFNISLTLMALIMGYSVDVAFNLFDSAIDRLKAWSKGLRDPGNNPPTNDPNKPST